MDLEQKTNTKNAKRLNEGEQQQIANMITSMYKSFKDNSYRQKHINLTDNIKTWESVNQEVKADQYKDGTFSTRMSARKSRVANQSWTRTDQMFNVKVKDIQIPQGMQEDDMTELQKFALTESLDNANYQKVMDKIFMNYDFSGEYIAEVGWEQHSTIRTVANPLGGNSLFKETVVEYDNAKITEIDSQFFEFDVARFIRDDERNWDKIIKIHKQFKTVEEISKAKYVQTDEFGQSQSYPIYNYLSKEDIRELKDTSKTSKQTDVETDKSLQDMSNYGEALEMLKAHGDFVINGKEYTNYICEVFNGKLARFEPNPTIINPYVMLMPSQDNQSKRGKSPWKSVYYGAIYRQEEINRNLHLKRLNANPPFKATRRILDALLKGAKEKILQWRAGMGIEIPEYESKDRFETVMFDTSGSAENIMFFDNEMNSNGATNANAMGNIEAKDTKATDLNLAKAGQDERIGDTLNNVYEFTKMVVERIASLNAIFKTGDQEVKIFGKNKGEANRTAIVTDIIRSANYIYEYEDRNAVVDKNNNFMAVYQPLLEGSQAGIVNPRYALTKLLEMRGFDNSEEFLLPETPMQQMANETKQMPVEQQQMIVAQVQAVMNGQAQVIPLSPQQQQLQAMEQQQGVLNE